MTARLIARSERIETAPNVRLIRFEKNSGQSAAIYAGLTAARGGTAGDH